MTRWAFGSLGIERIELPHAVDNAGVLPGGGEVRLPAPRACSRGAYRAEDGSRDDEHLHARLATD